MDSKIVLPEMWDDLAASVLEIFGDYMPQIGEYPVVISTNGVEKIQMVEMPISGIAGLDWEWLASVFLFALVLWSVFRLVGVLLSGR